MSGLREIGRSVLTDDKFVNLQILHRVLRGGLSFGLSIQMSNLLKIIFSDVLTIGPNLQWVLGLNGDGGLYSTNSNSARASCHRATKSEFAVG